MDHAETVGRTQHWIQKYLDMAPSNQQESINDYFNAGEFSIALCALAELMSEYAGNLKVTHEDIVELGLLLAEMEVPGEEVRQLIDGLHKLEFRS
jgi:hypothetical protein